MDCERNDNSGGVDICYRGEHWTEKGFSIIDSFTGVVVLTREASCSITVDDDDGRRILEGEHLLAWLHVPLLSWPFQHHYQVPCCCHRDCRESPCVILCFGSFVKVHSIIPWCVHHFSCSCTLVVYKSNGVKVHNSRYTQDLRCTWADWWKYRWQSCSGSQLVN